MYILFVLFENQKTEKGYEISVVSSMSISQESISHRKTMINIMSKNCLHLSQFLCCNQKVRTTESRSSSIYEILYVSLKIFRTSHNLSKNRLSVQRKRFCDFCIYSLSASWSHYSAWIRGDRNLWCTNRQDRSGNRNKKHHGFFRN